MRLQSEVRAGIAFNLDANLVQASLPLFASGTVDCLEWSFDAIKPDAQLPDWFEDLLQTFANENALIGHRVFFSLFSGKWLPEQAEWLKTLETRCRQFRFDHISEHFGFMTGENFHAGAPIPFPLNQTTLGLGHDRLMRIQQACGCPVGLENLAFAFSPDDVKRQGEFLNEVLQPVNGFLILDLHNVYCQTANFGLELEEVLSWYPLDRVREIHISGGSWEPSTVEKTRLIRRDTHDDRVPETVFNFLEKTLKYVPNLKFTILEQITLGLGSQDLQLGFERDFEKLVDIISKSDVQMKRSQKDRSVQSFMPSTGTVLSDFPTENLELYSQQVEFRRILENAESYESLLNQLSTSSISRSDWNFESWQPAMLETAMNIARKWKNGIAAL